MKIESWHIALSGVIVQAGLGALVLAWFGPFALLHAVRLVLGSLLGVLPAVLLFFGRTRGAGAVTGIVLGVIGVAAGAVVGVFLVVAGSMFFGTKVAKGRWTAAATLAMAVTLVAAAPAIPALLHPSLPQSCPQDPLGPLPPGTGDSLNFWTWADLRDPDPARFAAFCRMGEREKEERYGRSIAEARQLSATLEDYIRKWLAGEADPQVPKGLLPPTIDGKRVKNWMLLRPEEVRPEDQWGVYPAMEIPGDFCRLPAYSADNHVTYLVLIFTAPLGSELLFEGDFPHARFLSYQIVEPFDPRHPRTENAGPLEVPIVDVDIGPDPGHTNPFRAGADRNATLRRYHLTFDLAEGNMVERNPGLFEDIHYRAPGNRRVGGPFTATGVLGDWAILPGVLWVRYYAPDRWAGPLGGVGLPKALLQLPTGEKFWLQPDISEARRFWGTYFPGYREPYQEPYPFIGPDDGWLKMYDIMLIILESKTVVDTWFLGEWAASAGKAGLREVFACAGKGPRADPPGSIGHSATDTPYNSYLVRALALGSGKAYALTGKLPTTPKTRDGEPTMEPAQARYWSICHTGKGKEDAYPLLVYGCLMDDEITVNKNNEYVIAYSRPEDRPSNARPECGVTWQDFGLESVQVLTIRWMTVYPDHHMENFTPDDRNIPWETGAWSSEGYNQSLVGENRPGAMGPYHPLVHYPAKGEFEALGCPVNPASVPVWK